MYQNITFVNPLKPENKIWAVCYLNREGDENNVMKLDNKVLSVIKNGKKRQFEISEIKAIYKGHKRLLLPFITGGIISPMALLAISENAFSPVLLLIIFFTGLFLLYVGWNGSDALIIQMVKGKDEYILLRYVPEQVLKFIYFLNFFIPEVNKKNPKAPLFYHIKGFKADANGIIEEKPILLTPEEFQKYSSTSSLKSESFMINPLKLTYPVRLTGYPDGATYFTVKKINPESIVE